MAYESSLIPSLVFPFWPHFVPLIVSQAMLGFGGAGVALQLARRAAEKSPGRLFAWTVLLAAPAFDLAFRASQLVPFDPYLLLWDPPAWPRFGLFFFLLSSPFFLAGAATAIPFAFPGCRPGPCTARLRGVRRRGALGEPVPHDRPDRRPPASPPGAGAAACWPPSCSTRRDGARDAWPRCAPSSCCSSRAGPELFALQDLSATHQAAGSGVVASRFRPDGRLPRGLRPRIHSAP
jgi:hypothetical protein